MHDLTHTPLVSVIIPCYNHGRYLPEAVASVAGQTFNSWEIVIVDDGSSDNTVAVAQALIRRYATRSIRLISQPNRGPGASRDAGIAASQAPYVLLLDADDLIAAAMLERSVAVLEAQPHVGFVSTDVRFFEAETGSWSGGDPRRERLIYDCRMVVTTLFRRRAWKQAGGFHKQRNAQGYEDWDFWLRLVEQGWAGYWLPEPLVWYRRLAGGMYDRMQHGDLIFRARLVCDHPALYPRGFHSWAAATARELGTLRARGAAGAAPPGWLAAETLWWRSFVWYALLVAYHAPRELPKTLLRPFFKRLAPQAQMHARRFAQSLGLSKRAAS